MNKLTALIVDDEPLAHEIVNDYLADIPFIGTIHQCVSAMEAIGVLNEHTIDILFLDINMPKVSGIELLQSLNSKPQVIITSAYRQYALDSFELDVCDYLLKPFRFERFLKAVNRAATQIQLHTNTDNLVTNDHQLSKTLFLKVDKKITQVSINNIESLEAYGNYVKVWVGNESMLTPRTLSSFEKELIGNKTPFLRVHKSYLVQQSHIVAIENNRILLSSGREHALGKTYRHLSKTLLMLIPATK